MRNVAYALLALAMVAGVTWVMQRNSVPAPESKATVPELTLGLRQAVRILNRPDKPMTLQQRMNLYGVPGISIAIMEAGEIVSIHTAGVRDLIDKPAVDADTVFQAGSISKPVFATVLLHYRDQYGLDLDANINDLLTSWQLPKHRWSGKREVTLRQLLSHTAGMSLHGFSGHAVGEAIPNLTEILSGSPPANGMPVTVDVEPGTEFRYSGGGYVLAQLALEDVSGTELEEMARSKLFQSLNMNRSSFFQPLVAELESNAAKGYGPRGNPVPGSAHLYGAQSAAGLWTTPSDLLKWSASLWRASRGHNNEIVSPEAAAEMLHNEVAPVGLGLFVGKTGETTYFSHSGSNAGFEAKIIVFEQSGDGIGVMTNSNMGYILIEEIILRAAEIYGWDDIRPKTKMVLEVEPSDLQQFIGNFQASEPFPALIRVSLDKSSLILDAPDASFLVANKRFYPESALSFFSTDGQELVFLSDSEGAITSLTFNGFLSAKKSQ